MERRLAALAQRRVHLRARAAAERNGLVAGLERLREPARVFDRGVATFRYVRRHPVLVAAAGAAWFVWRRQGWTQAAALAWRLFRGWRARG